MQSTITFPSHKTYTELALRLRAAGTFTSLVLDISRDFPGSWPRTELEALAGESGVLVAAFSSTSPEDAGLAALENRLAALYSRLGDLESGLTCSKLRHSFSRLGGYCKDETAGLLTFYAFLSDWAELSDDRVDKMDYLVTRLGEYLRAAGDDAQYRGVLDDLWGRLGELNPPDEVVKDSLEVIGFLRERLVQVDSMEQLNDESSLSHYREVKRNLGPLRFEPSIAMAMLDANLHFKSVIGELYAREKESLFTELESLVELEDELGAKPEVDQLREGIRVFATRLDTKGPRVGAVVDLHKQARAAAALLRVANDDGDTAAGRLSEVPEEIGAGDSSHILEVPEAECVERLPLIELFSGSGWLLDTECADLIHVHLETILSTLADTDWDMPAAAVAATPAVSPLGLLPREIAAHRRLYEADSNLALERLIVECSAVRLTVSWLAEELEQALDTPHPCGQLTIFEQGASLAGELMSRLEHQAHGALEAGLIEEEQALRQCRTSLMREYSSLRPLLQRGEPVSRPMALSA